MEKQDPWLRSACHVAKNAIEKELWYLRNNLRDLLISRDKNNTRNISIIQNILDNQNLSWVDDDSIQNHILETDLGQEAFSCLRSLEEDLYQTIHDYRNSIIVFDMILNFVCKVIDHEHIATFKFFLWDIVISISQKDHLLSLFKQCCMPDDIVQAVLSTNMVFSDHHHINYPKEKILFQSVVTILRDKVLIPLLEHYMYLSTNHYNTDAIYWLYILKKNLFTKIKNRFELLLEDDVDDLVKENWLIHINNIQKDLLCAYVQYRSEIKYANTIKQLIELFTSLYQATQNSSETWEPFIYNKKTYNSYQDIVNLTNIISNHITTNWIGQNPSTIITEYITSMTQE